MVIAPIPRTVEADSRRAPAVTAPMAEAAVAVAVGRSTASTVWSLFSSRARVHPDRVAVQDGDSQLTYQELERRASRLGSALAAHGMVRGGRIAVLSENRVEYLEVVLAAARIGALVACQNWRLAPPELDGCLDLVEPEVVFASPRHLAALAAVPGELPGPVVFGEGYERTLAEAQPQPESWTVAPEDPLLILYTSGTTGLPKGATISHRAEIVRNLVTRSEFGIAIDDTFVAWSPLNHMGALDNALGTLMSGGKVIVVDGFDTGVLVDVVATEQVGWLLLMPGTIAAFAAALRDCAVRPRGVRVCGVMADLIGPHEIAEVTGLLGAPYANTFGSTETGCPPCSSSLIPVGVAPDQLAKVQSPFCEVRLIDPDGHDVADGTPGELCMRGPTLFSGYWRNPEATAHDFRHGWFHMGDVFVRNPDGTLDFVDRVKYLIKSGGENIYPAEIERVLLADPRVADAAVVRRPDARWGEVPVAFVARRDETLAAADLDRLCRERLAGYKRPKEIHFIAPGALPRSTSGKIQRHELEKRLT